MKPKPGDLVRITENIWENLAGGSYTSCHVLKDCIARTITWEEYCDYVKKIPGNNTDFDDLQRYMQRTGKQFTFVIVQVPKVPREINPKGADFWNVGEIGGAVILAENEFEILKEQDTGVKKRRTKK